jgi:16S rRNA (uracil1498-N3)-methyltransferase
VLRLRAGDELAVFDGRGGEWGATVEEVARDRVTVVAGAPREGDPEPRLRVTLFQARVRPERLEWVFQKGTEIGVAAFRIVDAERSEAAAPSAGRLDRYRRVVLEACKQSGRRRVPELAEGAIAAPAAGTLALLLDGGPGTPPVGHALRGASPPEVWIAVGPEGGFTPEEVVAAGDAGWTRASLGPRTLRTETAGAVAAALVLHRWDDLGPAEASI